MPATERKVVHSIEDIQILLDASNNHDPMTNKLNTELGFILGATKVLSLRALVQNKDKSLVLQEAKSILKPNKLLILAANACRDYLMETTPESERWTDPVSNYLKEAKAGIGDIYVSLCLEPKFEEHPWRDEPHCNTTIKASSKYFEEITTALVLCTAKTLLNQK